MSGDALTAASAPNVYSARRFALNIALSARSVKGNHV